MSLQNYRTGHDQIDQKILEFVEAVPSENRDLIAEILVTAFRLGNENADRGELKLVNNALKELRHAFHVFSPYRDHRKATLFGSARIKKDDPTYRSARQFGAEMVKRDWMVMTGAGPGIMAAGLEGAGTENSFGINIDLPFENTANPFIADDPKLINFKYFFTRKVTFMKESHGYALLPGGFGTMDEAFELLTLMQTGKSPISPVVLLDPPGSTYWERWVDFIRTELLEGQLISENDLAFIHVTSDPAQAADHLSHFYSTFHSIRFVAGRLVLRLNRPVEDAELSALNSEFGDLLESGNIERIEATSAELSDDDQVNLHRLALRYHRAGQSRVRLLIDALNDYPS